MNVSSVTETKNGKTRMTKIGKPKKSFTAVVKEGELMMNFSLASDTVDDGKGNPVTFYLWATGDWKVDYKGKEYLIPVSENITAFINWVNAKGAK